MQIPSSMIVLRLVTEFDYSQKNAEEVVEKLHACAPSVQEAFEKWWQGEGSDEALSVQGYTLPRLMKEYEMTPIAACLTLDWLIREPEVAVPALAHGYDTLEL